MGFPRFYGKASVSAAQILQGVSKVAFLERMSRTKVALSFGDDAAMSREGRVAAELATNILARLFPTISIIAEGPHSLEIKKELGALALAINPQLEILDGEKNDIVLQIGSESTASAPVKIYVGSNGWEAFVSSCAPRKCGDSELPFGAAAAACLGCANVFRSVFADVLPSGALDHDASLLVGSFESGLPLPSDAGGFRINDAHLVGAGAIGNGLLWTLAKVPGIEGTLHVVDPESVDLGNLQRYVLTTDSSEKLPKVEVAAAAFAATGIKIVPHARSWGGYLQSRGDHQIGDIAVALDSAEHRIAVQASLPRRVVNAWTQQQNFGISRHDAFGAAPCLACLYMPDGALPDEDDLIMAALRMPDMQQQIRLLLHTGAPVPPDFVEEAERRAGLEAGALRAFVGEPIRAFYSKAVCGGLLVHAADQIADVPMPFQSALAGVLLAAELVLGARPLPTVTSINLLRPLGQYPSYNRERHYRCFCGDPVFHRRFAEKWPPKT